MAKKSVKKNEGQAILWLTDETGRRMFPVAKNAAAGLPDEIKLPDTQAMPGVLTTMRAQSTSGVLTTMRAQSTSGVLTTMRAQSTSGVLTTMRAQASRH